MLEKTDVFGNYLLGERRQCYLVDASDKYIDEYFEALGGSDILYEWAKLLNRSDYEWTDEVSIYKFVGIDSWSQGELTYSYSYDLVFPSDKSYKITYVYML